MGGERGSHGGWDTVAEAGQRYEAELIADRLRDAGIEATVVDQSFRQEPLTRVAAFSAVRVLVPLDRTEAARRLLAEPMVPLDEDTNDLIDGATPSSVWRTGSLLQGRPRKLRARSLRRPGTVAAP